VALLIGTLALSVDLIEYQPQEPRDRLSDRPLPETLGEREKSRAASMRKSVSTASVVTANPIATGVDGSGFDVTLMPADAETDTQRERVFVPPRQPYATGGQR